MVSQGGGKGRIDDHDDEGDRERDTIDRVDDLNKINHEKEEEEEAQTVFSAGTAFTWEIREKVNYELKMKKQRQQEEEERGKKKERKAILSASDEEELNGLLQALQILSWNMTDREKSIWTQGNGAVLWRCCGSVLFDTSLFSSSSLGSSLSSRRREKQEERERSSLLLLFNSLLSGSLGGGGGVAESRVGSEVAFLARRSTEYARNRPVSSSSSSQVSMPSSGSLLTKMSGDPSSHAKSEGADKEEEKEEEREGEEKMKKEEGEGEEGEGEREKNKKKAGEGEDRKERICVIHGSPSVSDFAQAACKDSRPSSAAATKLHIDAPRQEKEETIPGHSSPPPSSSSITPTRDTSLSSSSLACNLDTSLVIPTTTAAPPSSSLLPSSPPCSLPSLFASCSPSSISSSFSPLSLESSNLRSSSSSPSHPLLLQTDLKNRSITQLTRSVLRDLPSSSCSLSSSMSSFTSSSSQFFFSSSTPVSSVSPSPSFFLSSSRLKESIGSIIRSCSPSLLSACAAILASLFESFWRTQGLFSVFPPTISSSSSSIEHSISLVSGDPLHPASQLRSYLQENVYLVYHALELLGRSNSSCYVKSLRSSTRQESLHISAIFREILATVSGEVFLKREEERSSTSEALTGPCTSLCMIKSGEDSDKRKKKSSSFEGEDKARRNKIQIVFTGWEKRQKILWLRGFFKHSLSQHLRDDSSAFLSFFLFGASRWKRPEGSEETRRGARRMTENDPNLCRRDKESDCREFSSSSFASSFASWRTSKHREKVRAHQRQARNSVRTLLMNPGMSED
ncbi:hypothetical protein CSUI_007848 [Cystoisospora suis]|uniref:Uncharacterized protein n=1 Tax=Cystoisospora suis TaxID=483139 RepID=A0A2C6KNZ2_9APIC|nr:hypothetical protein CSUI_007848 [Cystoisospora suis]